MFIYPLVVTKFVIDVGLWSLIDRISEKMTRYNDKWLSKHGYLSDGTKIPGITTEYREDSRIRELMKSAFHYEKGRPKEEIFPQEILESQLFYTRPHLSRYNESWVKKTEDELGIKHEKREEIPVPAKRKKGLGKKEIFAEHPEILESQLFYKKPSEKKKLTKEEIFAGHPEILESQLFYNLRGKLGSTKIADKFTRYKGGWFDKYENYQYSQVRRAFGKARTKFYEKLSPAGSRLSSARRRASNEFRNFGNYMRDKGLPNLRQFYRYIREGWKRPSTIRREAVEPLIHELDVAQDILQRVTFYGRVPDRMSLWLGDLQDYVDEMRAIIGGNYVKDGPENIEDMLTTTMTDYVNRALDGIGREINQIPQERRDHIDDNITSAATIIGTVSNRMIRNLRRR